MKTIIEESTRKSDISHWQYYQSQHQTLGCKLTHLFGIPLIISSFPLLLMDWRMAALTFALGWTLQLVGHYVFEKTTPVLFTDRKAISTISVALSFALKGWLALFSKPRSLRPIKNSEPESNKG